MMQLSEEITTTENRIASARQGYNDLVQKFNEYKKSFPNVILAGVLLPLRFLFHVPYIF
jgi:LemA protein